MAKKFTFPAEAVLQLRKQREQVTLRKLADTQQRVSAIQDALRRLRAELDEQDVRVRQGVLTGTVDVQYMSLYRRYVMSLHARIIDDVRRLQTEAAQLQRCRTEVIEAVKQRKVMDKLKEKLFATYRRKAERDERNEMDEIGSIRFGHPNANGEVV